MQFIHKDLGQLRGGEIVEVSLNGRANIKLMNGSNFNSYKRGQRHNFYGGQATKSPVRLQVPSSGHWHVTVDLGGYAGRIKASVRILPGMLRPITERPLSEVPTLVQDKPPSVDDDGNSRTYDVFISHASEDKDNVVRPLASALKSGGLEVWYDEFELKIGDSLRRKIDKGLASSRFGIVVLSQAFFQKGWTNYELDGLVTRSVSGDQILLPIWHNVSKQEVMDYSPSLADKVARNTTSHTIDEISAEIIELIESQLEGAA